MYIFNKISWMESFPPVGLENEDVLKKQKNNSFLSNLSLSLPLHVKYYWKERKIGTESNIKGVSNKAETCWLEGQSVTNCIPFSLQLWSRPWGKNSKNTWWEKNIIQSAHLCFNSFHVTYFLILWNHSLVRWNICSV